MRPTIKFFVVASLFSIMVPAHSFDLFKPHLWFLPDACSVYEPQVLVDTFDFSVKLDRTKSTSEIDAIHKSRDSNMAISLDNARTHGLAIANLQIDTKFDLMLQRLSDGRYCGNVVFMNYKIGYKDPVHVMVSNNHMVGSCQYNVMYEHEMQHVSLYRKVLNDYLSIANSVLYGELVNVGSVYGDSSDEVEVKLSQIVSEIGENFSEMVSHETKVRNAPLDTYESYRDLESRCHYW